MARRGCGREIERKFGAEERQLEARFDQERIQLRSTTRERLAAVERELQAKMAAALNTMAASGGAMNLGGTAEATFAKAEIEAEMDYWLEPSLSARQQRELAAINRRRAQVSTELAARYLDAGEDTAAMRTRVQQASAIEARWQEKLDELEFERSIETAKLQRARRRAENEFSRDQAALLLRNLAKAAADPDGAGAAAAGAGLFGAMGDPEMVALQEKRDEAINACEREIEELSARLDVRRADLEARRDDELAEAADA